jgi:hypothetical protein
MGKTRKVDLQEIEAKRAEREGRTEVFGAHTVPTGGRKFKANNIYRSDGRRKGVKTEPVKYFIPKTPEEKAWAMAHVREVERKAKAKDEIRIKK